MSCDHKTLVWNNDDLRCAECNIGAKSVVEVLHGRLATAERERDEARQKLAVAVYALNFYASEVKAMPNIADDALARIRGDK